MDVILILNSGSSSMKFSLFDIKGEQASKLLVRGQLEGIGTEPYFKVTDSEGKLLQKSDWADTPSAQVPNREQLIQYVIEWLDGFLGNAVVKGIGHRVVHGGALYTKPVIITDEVLAELERLTSFAPLHQPSSLAPVYAFRAKARDIPQVACFDTSFHYTMPAVAKRVALPRRYNESDVRRYGFHGLSYQYIAEQLPEISPVMANGRVIVAHLGNGASLCAMHKGRSVETTMSFTALDGLVMGTRCGRIDPGILLYLMREQKLDADQIEDLLYRQSGLLGVSGISNDMRELRQLLREDSNSKTIEEAINLFTYRIICEMGSLIAALGGVDGIVFTAGIGENDAELREKVCEGLSWLGISLDKPANNLREAGLISTKDSKVEVRVIRTNEEQVMLENVMNTIQT